MQDLENYVREQMAKKQINLADDFFVNLSRCNVENWQDFRTFPQALLSDFVGDDQALEVLLDVQKHGIKEMTEIERDLRVMSSQAEVTLADKFFEELRQTFRCTSWDIFIQLPQYMFKGQSKRARQFLKECQKRKRSQLKPQRVVSSPRPLTKFEEFVDTQPKLKQAAICTVARLCSFAQQGLDTVHFAGLVVTYLSFIFELSDHSRKLPPEQLEFSLLFARWMRYALQRPEKMEHWTSGEAQLAEKARRWKSVLKHCDSLLAPGLFLTGDCPLCGETPSQIAPLAPLAPGHQENGFSKALAVKAYALLLEDNTGELVWCLASLGLDVVEPETVTKVRKLLEEKKYPETPHLTYLTQKLLPKLELIANGEGVKACPFPASPVLANSKQTPSPEEASSAALKMGFFPKKLRSGDRGEKEFAKLMEISALELTAFAATHFRGLNYIWMDNGGYQLDRMRKIPQFKILDPDKQVQLFLGLAEEGRLGLQALHASGHYHGDIKPTNVVIGIPPNYQWLFIDYSGLDRTPAYMDPSSIHDGSPAPVSSTDDTYALLLTILEIVFNAGSPCAKLGKQTPSPQAVKRFYNRAEGPYLKQAFSQLPKSKEAHALLAFFKPMARADLTDRRDRKSVV